MLQLTTHTAEVQAMTEIYGQIDLFLAETWNNSISVCICDGCQYIWTEKAIIFSLG